MTINTFLRHKKPKLLIVLTLVLVSLVYSTILLFSFIAIPDTRDKSYTALAFKPTPPSNQNLPNNNSNNAAPSAGNMTSDEVGANEIAQTIAYSNPGANKLAISQVVVAVYT
jgi:hypothetical protein